MQGTSQAEDTLFRVWSTSFRRHSKTFVDMLETKAHQKFSTVPDGSDDEHPLVLSDVKADDFECLLWIIYPA